MEIDLNDTQLGFAETNYESMRLKSNKLIKEMQFYISSENLDHNFMIIPMSIFNILETSPSFKHSHIDERESPGILYVGDIFGFKCYLNIHQPSDTITLSYDKSIMRDNKIDSILNNDKLKEEIEITVLNY
jgi:hypothetical protein